MDEASATRPDSLSSILGIHMLEQGTTPASRPLTSKTYTVA